MSTIERYTEPFNENVTEPESSFVIENEADEFPLPPSSADLILPPTPDQIQMNGAEPVAAIAVRRCNDIPSNLHVDEEPAVLFNEPIRFELNFVHI